MSNIFRDFAPLYWEAGLPVMPLKQRDKRPILSEWQSYGSNMPSAAIRDHWLGEFPKCNIGLPFGPASGLCAIDIDTLDEELVAIIESCLPESPWRRVGKKGCALVYRWQGQKNFKIRSEEGMICEFLGLGNQLVLPPSIHPDTGRAYEASCNLWEVMDKIPALGVDIEQKLRDALGIKGVSLSHEGRSKPLDVVPAGERDIQLVRHAGYLARCVFGMDRNFRPTLSEAVAHMVHWVQNYTAKQAGDDMDPQKGAAKLLEFLLRDIEGGRTLPEGWDGGLTDEQRAHPTIVAIGEKNQAERWDSVRAREWLQQQINEKPNDDRWALAKVRELVSKVARDEQFDEFEYDALIPHIERALGTGAKMSRPAIKKMFGAERALGGGDAEEAADDHEAIARQVLEEMGRGGELKHCQGSFWQWNGSCHEQLDDSRVYRFVAERVKGNKLAKRHNDYAAIVKTIGILCEGELEENPELGVNFANGFLDMNGVLHDHSPTFGKTFTMPFNYVEARRHECHRWLGMLEMAWGDDTDFQDKVDALQEVMAATMFGLGPKYQRAILLYGKGETGKSVVLDILRAMMPENAVCALPPHKWGERFQLTSMVGKVLNVCGELPEAAMIAGDRFKGIVGGEPQDTEYKGKDGFTFSPICTHWFASNHLPRTRDDTDGFTRRWIIFEFTRKIRKEDRVLGFADIVIAEEREAIAAWVVDGLRRLLSKKEYTLPTSHARLENLILRTNNSVAAFLQSSERVRPQEESVADCKTVFEQYGFYMKEVSSGQGVGYERFKVMLQQLGYDVDDYQDAMRVTRSKVKGLVVNLVGEKKA